MFKEFISKACWYSNWKNCWPYWVNLLFYVYLLVTYWPQPSCQKKKCTCVNNRCIQSKISGTTLTVEGLNWVRIVTLARSRWVSNYHITPVTGSSDQLERRCWNENHVPAEAGPPGPRLSSPGEWERNAAVARRVGGSICCSSVQSPTLLSHSKTFSNPFEPFQ